MKMAVSQQNPYIPALRDDLPHTKDNRNEIIENYFNLGFSHLEILGFITLRHGWKLSLRQLRRVLKSRGLHRRKSYTDLQQIVSVIQDELKGSSSRIGYRQIWNILRNQYHYVVRREDIRLILGVLDPEGVEARTRKRLRRRKYYTKGPNYYWHVDGNDKLKAYGLYVHGAIDGYSRRVMWLKVGCTNKREQVIARYYLEAVKELQGIPQRLRFDPGVENGMTADLQVLLASLANGEEDCVRFGKSTANQRIEAWWSYFKPAWAAWWMDFFQDLMEQNILNNSSSLHVAAVQFCFMSVLQKELDKVRQHWNTHRIRPVHESECPSGRPDTIFFLPSVFGTEDYKQPVDNDVMQWMKENKSEPLPENGCDDDYAELFLEVMLINGSQFPKDASSALALYQSLLQTIDNAVG